MDIGPARVSVRCMFYYIYECKVMKLEFDMVVALHAYMLLMSSVAGSHILCIYILIRLWRMGK